MENLDCYQKAKAILEDPRTMQTIVSWLTVPSFERHNVIQNLELVRDSIEFQIKNQQLKSEAQPTEELRSQ